MPWESTITKPSELSSNLTLELVPIPTSWFAITLKLTVSPTCNPWAWVVVTVVVGCNTDPLTAVPIPWTKYPSSSLPLLVKNNSAPFFSVLIPIVLIDLYTI